jgi:hypothetical protein
MMTLIFVYLVAQTTWDIQYLIGSHKNALVIVYTYIFAFIVDQIKSVGSHIIIYYVVVRRFIYLKENLKDFSHKDAEKTQTENAIPRLQGQLLKMLESTMFETASLVNIAAYTVFILQDLTLSDTFNFNPIIIAKIDRIFLWIFAIEILLKTFASNGTYLLDKFNAFDAIIVFLSVALN